MNDREHHRCGSAGVCGGCSWIVRPWQEQLTAKQRNFRSLWGAARLPENVLEDMSWHVPAREGLRERVDLVLENGVLGLRGLDDARVVALENCYALTESLWKWVQEFRQDLPSIIGRGSVRLRVAPDGCKGAWLDFSNVTIKQLLDDQLWLRRLMDRAHVEMGQRRKVLIIKEDRLGLGDPVLLPWTQTSWKGELIPIYGTVGSFTQVGMLANRALVEVAVDHPHLGKNVMELGSGCGSFTLPLIHSGRHVIAVENDSLALEGLTRGAADLAPELRARLEIEAVSFTDNRNHWDQLLNRSDSLFVDPPRSGLGSFVETLATRTLPEFFTYVSCYAETLALDLRRLIDLGYGIKTVTAVEQFPQTPHCEYVVALKLR